ncbi:MAG: phosphate signaling complex protein PhoU [Gracilibacteraceae bacterium]|jgi:phosphate transport system protein|nr:phosphate signaling complex protein PhoU [Gracilibacteraceae bacterium]
MKNIFARHLTEMKSKVIAMGAMVGKSIDDAVISLRERDLALARAIMANDDAVDALEKEIEQLCTHLIATCQPFAADLRHVIAGYKIITALERMGDLAVDMAQVSLRIGPEKLIKPLIDIPAMAREVQIGIKEVITAYTGENPDGARRIAEIDDKVDMYYGMIVTELCQLMEQKPALVSQGVQLVLVARFLERIGDYATNIGEEIIYMSLGVRESLNE